MRSMPNVLCIRGVAIFKEIALLYVSINIVRMNFRMKDTNGNNATA